MTPRILAFALIEMASLFCVSSGVVFFWRGTPPWSVQEVLTLVGEALLVPLCFFTVFYSCDLYNVRAIRSLGDFRRRLVGPVFAVFALLLVISLLMPTFTPLGSSVVLVNLLLVLLGAMVVVVLRWGLYTFGSISPFAERILVLGTGELAWKVASLIRAISPLGYTIAGFVDDEKPVGKERLVSLPAPILGPLNRVEQIIEQFRPDRIIVALRERRGRLPLPPLLKAHWAGVVVEDGVKVYERFSGKLAVENLTPGFLIFATDFKKLKLQESLRRLISLVVAMIGLVLFAPLLVLIAVAIKLDSQGPVFFIQERAGLNGRIFHLIKFRTMHPASVNEGTESVWNRDLCSRITRVGGWLRKTHFDELPQFFNILRGDMDLVGPRPEMAENINVMEERIPYYALRMAVRPGMTGWAQVKNGYAVSQEDVTEKIRYDLYYIRHRSLWLDFRILIDTARLILWGQNDSTPQSEKVEAPPPVSVKPANDGNSANLHLQDRENPAA